MSIFQGVVVERQALPFEMALFYGTSQFFWESNLKRKSFQIGSTSYSEIHGPLVLSLSSTDFTHGSRAHVRLLLGSCIVAQTMVLDEPNWRDWTEAHMCHVVSVEMVHHLKCQICRFKKNENVVSGFIVVSTEKIYQLDSCLTFF